MPLPDQPPDATKHARKMHRSSGVRDYCPTTITNGWPVVAGKVWQVASTDCESVRVRWYVPGSAEIVSDSVARTV